MSEYLTPKKLETLFRKNAAEISEELNGRFACRMKTVSGEISVRLKFYLASGSVSGLAEYSDIIYLESSYYHSLLSNNELVKQALEISGNSSKRNGCKDFIKQFIRALIFHEYAHKMCHLEFKEIYKDPRFDDDRQRHILTAASAIIEDVKADEMMSRLYPKYYKSIRFMRTLLALAVNQNGNSISDPLFYEAVRMLAPDVKIFATNNEATERLDALFKKALSQKTLSGKFHIIEKITDFLAEDELYHISSDFKLFLAGYETHFLNACNEYFAIGNQMIRRFSPSENGIKINYLEKLSSKDYEMLRTNGDGLVPSKPYFGNATNGANNEFVTDNAEEVSDSEDSEDSDNPYGLPQFKIDIDSLVSFYGYTPPDVDIYKTITDINSSLINNYSLRFQKLLIPNQEEREEKLLYGKGINSSRLVDVKKRYWFSGTETTDPRNAFDVTIQFYSTAVFNGINDLDHIFSENCYIPNRYLVYGLIAAVEALEKVNVNTAIVTGVHFMGGIQPRKLKELNERDTKYQIGKFLREANNSGLDGTGFAPYVYLGLDLARSIIESSQADKHILIYISDIPTKPKEYYDESIENDCSKSMEKVRKMTRQEGIAFSAVALDYNNGNDKQCYPILSKAFPNVVQCTNREGFPRQLLGTIEKIIKRFI